MHCVCLPKLNLISQNFLLCLFLGQGWAHEKLTSAMEGRRKAVTSLGVHRGWQGLAHCCVSEGSPYRWGQQPGLQVLQLLLGYLLQPLRIQVRGRCSSTARTSAHNLRHWSWFFNGKPSRVPVHAPAFQLVLFVCPDFSHFMSPSHSWVKTL